MNEEERSAAMTEKECIIGEKNHDGAMTDTSNELALVRIIFAVPLQHVCIHYPLFSDAKVRSC